MTLNHLTNLEYRSNLYFFSLMLWVTSLASTVATIVKRDEFLSNILVTIEVHQILMSSNPEIDFNSNHLP